MKLTVNNKLTKAKELIKKNKLKEALILLHSLSIKKNDYFYDDVIFEIAKIYLISKKYLNSLKLFKKIKKESLLPYVYDFIFKIYKLLDDKISLIKTYNKNLKYYGQKVEYIKTIIDVTMSLNRYKKAMELLSVYRTKFGNDVFVERKSEELYKNICIYIQRLNIKNNYKEVKNFFKNVYELIPISKHKVRNILLNEYEIASKKVILKSIPRQLTILLTNKCNLRCIMCNLHNTGKRYYELSNENCEELLSIIPYLDRLILQGGEVLLYKNFYKITKKASENNVCTEIVTNGLLLNEKLLKILINMNSIVTVSIDGFNKKVYEKIRVGGKFERLLVSLGLLRKFKKNKSNKMILRLQIVVMKSNYKQINMALNFAKKYCFDEVSLIPIRSGNTLSEECIFDIKYNDKAIKYLSLNRDNFEKKANKLNIKLINNLPNIKDSDYIVKNKMEHTPILKFDNMKTKKVYKNSKIENNNIFCFLPWKTAYYNGVCMLPTCFCPAQESDFIYDNCNKSILKEWNRGTILIYRKKIIEQKNNLICNKLCLNNNILSNEKKMVIY